MKIIACALLVALLTACQTAPPTEQKVVEVEKLVRVPCIDKKPDAPVYQMGRGERPSEVELSGVLIRDFEAAEKYGQAWEAAAAGCIIAPSGKE